MTHKEYCPNCFSPIQYPLSEEGMKIELNRRLYPQAEEFKYLEDRCDLCNRPLPVDPIPPHPRELPSMPPANHGTRDFTLDLRESRFQLTRTAPRITSGRRAGPAGETRRWAAFAARSPRVAR